MGLDLLAIGEQIVKKRHCMFATHFHETPTGGRDKRCAEHSCYGEYIVLFITIFMVRTLNLLAPLTQIYTVQTLLSLCLSSLSLSTHTPQAITSETSITMRQNATWSLRSQFWYSCCRTRPFPNLLGKRHDESPRVGKFGWTRHWIHSGMKTRQNLTAEEDACLTAFLNDFAKGGDNGSGRYGHTLELSCGKAPNQRGR